MLIMKKRYPLYRVLWIIVIWPWRLLFNPKIIGKENLPKSGGFVLAGNHINFWDFAVMACLTRRNVRFLAAEKLFAQPIVKQIISRAGALKVERHKSGQNSGTVSTAVEALKNNEIVFIAPEGTRNRAHQAPLLPFKPGAVIIASRSGKPLVPYVLSGKFKVFGWLFDRRNRLKVVILKPYRIPQNADIEQETARLREKVYQELVTKK
jgi:1-acyl-sn-glycerol-3-phosphate acyltransferase